MPEPPSLQRANSYYTDGVSVHIYKHLCSAEYKAGDQLTYSNLLADQSLVEQMY